MRLSFALLAIVLLTIATGPFLLFAKDDLHVTNVKRQSTSMSANIVSFDAMGQVQRPSSVNIYHNGEWKSIPVQCPPGSPLASLSSVLAVDVSGSMAQGGPNIALAKTAARAWITSMNETSECAIVAFDHTSRIVTDFSNDTSELLAAVESLRPRGGTDYGAGFQHASGGALNVAREARHKKVIVFLTDGFGGGNADSIIAAAKEQKATVYCVTLGMAIPDVLRRVSEETGGLWFEHVTTPAEASLAYKRILSAATTSPCIAQWSAEIGCANVDPMMFATTSDTVRYLLTVPDIEISGVRYTPPAIGAGFVPEGQAVSRTFAIKATGTKVIISSMRLVGPPTMSLTTPSLPITLMAGDSVVVGVTIRSGDSAYTVGRVEFNSMPCPIQPYYIASGSPGMPPRIPTLKVVYPNGGERIYAGEAIPLTYAGVPPTDRVDLQVSTNFGKTWIDAGSSSVGNKLVWTTPIVSSDSCLLRAIHSLKPDPNVSAPQFVIKGERIDDASFSPDGKFIVTSGWEQKTPDRKHYGVVRIWDAQTGSPIRKLDASYHHTFMPDGRHIVTWGDKNVMLWNVESGALVWDREITPTNAPTAIEIARISGSILVVGGWGDTTLVLDPVTGNTVAQFARTDKAVHSGSISYDGKMVAICEQDSSLNIFDGTTGALLRIIRDPNVRRYYRAVFQPGSYNMGVAAGDGTMLFINAVTGEVVKKITARQFYNDNTYVAFNQNGNLIAVETGMEQTKIYDVVSGAEQTVIQRSNTTSALDAFFTPASKLLTVRGLYQSNVFDATSGVQIKHVRGKVGRQGFAPDNSKFITIVEDKLAEVHPIVAVTIQSDTSDARWSIVKPKATLKSIRFAPLFVGQSKDTVLSAAIENNGPDTLFVRNVGIEGAQATSFGIRTTGEFAIPPGKDTVLELSFTPQQRGELAALLVATVRGGRLTSRITGPAYPSIVSAQGGIVDFGSVHIGETRSRTLKDVVTNTNNIPLTIKRYELSGPDTSVFKFNVPENMDTLKPGDSYVVNIAFTPTDERRMSTSLYVYFNETQEPIELIAIGRGDTLQPYRDPTTFRMVMIPSSVMPPKGAVVAGSYLGVGLMAGYAINDNLMILGGGVIPVPTRLLGAEGFSASTSTAYSIGLKTGVRFNKRVTLAGGWQFGHSRYDQDFSPVVDSKITFNAIWCSLGYGTDDSRFNAFLGYAFKRHVTAFTGSFNADAVLIGMGYDRKLADQWKICGEAAFMRSMTFVPINITARWFNNVHAIDAGIMITAIPASGAASSGFPVVPVVSWVARF